MAHRAYHRFPLSTEQFEELVPRATAKAEFSDYYYDDERASLTAKGWLLRKRFDNSGSCAAWSLDMLGDSDDRFVRYEGSAIGDFLPNHRQTHRVVAYAYDTVRYWIPLQTPSVDAITYIERASLSVNEDFLVGTSTLPRDVIEPLLGLTTALDKRPSRSKIVEWMYGFEPSGYDKLVELGSVSERDWCCSRRVNRPNAQNGISFEAAKNLWHLLDDSLSSSSE